MRSWYATTEPSGEILAWPVRIRRAGCSRARRRDRQREICCWSFGLAQEKHHRGRDRAGEDRAGDCPRYYPAAVHRGGNVAIARGAAMASSMSRRASPMSLSRRADPSANSGQQISNPAGVVAGNACQSGSFWTTAASVSVIVSRANSARPVSISKARPECPDVARACPPPPSRLLGTHVGRGAEDHAGTRPAPARVGDARVGAGGSRLDRLGESEVEHLDDAVRGILMFAGLRSRCTMPCRARLRVPPRSVAQSAAPRRAAAGPVRCDRRA